VKLYIYIYIYIHENTHVHIDFWNRSCCPPRRWTFSPSGHAQSSPSEIRIPSGHRDGGHRVRRPARCARGSEGEACVIVCVNPKKQGKHTFSLSHTHTHTHTHTQTHTPLPPLTLETQTDINCCKAAFLYSLESNAPGQKKKTHTHTHTKTRLLMFCEKATPACTVEKAEMETYLLRQRRTHRCTRSCYPHTRTHMHLCVYTCTHDIHMFVHRQSGKHTLSIKNITSCEKIKRHMLCHT